MEKPDKKKFTPRNAAKKVCKSAIRLKTAQFVKNRIVDYTDHEKDNIVVWICGDLVGWYVSDKLEPYTDKMVDTAADFINAKREEMKEKSEEAKKDATEEK